MGEVFQERFGTLPRLSQSGEGPQGQRRFDLPGRGAGVFEAAENIVGPDRETRQ